MPCVEHSWAWIRNAYGDNRHREGFRCRTCGIWHEGHAIILRSDDADAHKHAITPPEGRRTRRRYKRTGGKPRPYRVAVRTSLRRPGPYITIKRYIRLDRAMEARDIIEAGLVGGLELGEIRRLIDPGAWRVPP